MDMSTKEAMGYAQIQCGHAHIRGSSPTHVLAHSPPLSNISPTNSLLCCYQVTPTVSINLAHPVN